MQITACSVLQGEQAICKSIGKQSFKGAHFLELSFENIGIHGVLRAHDMCIGALSVVIQKAAFFIKATISIKEVFPHKFTTLLGGRKSVIDELGCRHNY